VAAVSTFWFVALIIGVFFASGIVVGFLAVMAIPSLVAFLAARTRGESLDPGDQLDIGPPAGGPGYREPDDRDPPPGSPGPPWWRGGT
jgi:hypothetical protein